METATMGDTAVLDTRPARAESTQMGREARALTSRGSHADWDEPHGRVDPIALLEGQNATRLPWLIPLRHARMGVSAFTYYRGAAIVMAGDLAGSPTSGLTVQLGGDAHLSNFGAYASPGRQLVVDANDFDETQRGPWEWDVKRLATSVTIAAEDIGLGKQDTRRATLAAVTGYAAAMAEFADEGYLETWNRSQEVDGLSAATGVSQRELDRRLRRFGRKARSRSHLQAVGKLTEVIDGRRIIRDQPPLLTRVRSLPADFGDADDYERAAHDALDQYRNSLNDARRFLLDRYELIDVGLKVVGVGSVGMRCLILLLQGRDENDTLLLQAKEAQSSVLEPHVGPSPYSNHGQRVVEGQRLVQAQSDIFLGWTEGRVDHRQYYIRQLRDWKGSVEVEGLNAGQLSFYSDLCGRTLARGHARTGDAAAIHAYVGGGRKLGKAIISYSESYAAQNRSDYGRFIEAVRDGRLDASPPE